MKETRRYVALWSTKTTILLTPTSGGWVCVYAQGTGYQAVPEEVGRANRSDALCTLDVQALHESCLICLSVSMV